MVETDDLSSIDPDQITNIVKNLLKKEQDQLEEKLTIKITTLTGSMMDLSSEIKSLKDAHEEEVSTRPPSSNGKASGGFIPFKDPWPEMKQMTKELKEMEASVELLKTNSRYAELFIFEKSNFTVISSLLLVTWLVYRPLFVT